MLHVRERDKPDPVRGCSVISWLLLSWAIAALLVIAVVSCVATPRPQPETVPPGASVPVWVEKYADSVHMAQAGTGAPHVSGGTHSAGEVRESAVGWHHYPDQVSDGAPPLSAFYASLAADAYRPRIDTLTGTAADVTRQGDWSYADPSYGPGYLAIPEGPGWLIRACGPAACLERTSTDAGPDLALQRAGRLGDLSARDWQAICGVPLSLGLCPGSLTLLHRPLPETDLDVR